MRIRSRGGAAPALAVALALASVLPAAAADWEITSLPAGYQYQVAVAPSGEIVACGGATVYRSSDDGATWSPAGPFAAHGFPHALSFSPSGALFASDFALGVFRSDDLGATWTPSLVDEGCNGIGVGPGGVVYAGLTYTGNGMVHRSTDDGAQWQGVSLPGASHSFATECFGFGDSAEVYAGTIDGLYRSTDHGLTWTEHSTGLLGQHVRTLAVAPDQDVYVQTLYPALFDGLYRSTDRGRTWQRVPAPAPYFSAMLVGPGGEILGTQEGAVHRSTDRGLTWVPSTSGLNANERLTSIAITPTGRLITGGWRVYRSTSSLLAAEGPSSPEVALAPVQPNPVRGSTRVRFALPRAMTVELAVFDISGRRVATLFDGPGGAGEHAVAFETRSLPVGAYVCRLNAGGLSLSRRLLIVR